MKNSEDYLAKIKTDLANDNVTIRRNCLNELCKVIQNETNIPDSDAALNLFKLVIKVFNDKIESCREQAMQTALACLKLWTLPAEDTVFLLLPIVHKKLTNDENPEPSEEIRLLLVTLLKISIQKFMQGVSLFIVEIVDILNRSIRDRCPDVIRESCECFNELAETVPEFRLHSDKVVTTLISATKHKHYRIRVAAIQSCEKIVLFGQSDSLESVFGALGECLLDLNPHVRGAVYKVAFSWFKELRDRYSYFHFILPLILTGLNDENSTYKEEAQNWWNEMGVQYFKENEEDLKDKQEFLPSKLENYPCDVDRPNLGCRTLVSKEAGKIIPTLMKELEDWRPEVRVKSAELLEVIALNIEINIVPYLENILPATCRVCSRNEENVNERIAKSLEIIGYFVSPTIYWHLLVSLLKDNCSSGHYIILTSLLKHSPKNEISQQLDEIIQTILENNICETKDLKSCRCVLEIISKLIVCCEASPLEDDKLKNLHFAIVSVMAFDDKDIRIEAADTIEKLSRTIPATVRDLHKICLPPLFSRLLNSCEMWESYSTDLSILNAILAQYPNDVIEIVADELLDILNVILKSNSDREIVFKTLFTIATLFDADKIKINEMEFYEKIILGPLKQQLIWKAGRVSEVTRGMAVAIVLLFIKENGNVSQEFLSNIIPLIISLCEDSYEETRIYSLKILSYVGLYGGRNIDVNLFKHILTVVAGRLEDKRNDVRLRAAQSLKNILRDAPRFDAMKGMPDFENVIKALELLFIHVDDIDDNITSALLELFKDPDIIHNVKSVFSEKVLSSFITKCRCKSVSTTLETCLKI